MKNLLNKLKELEQRDFDVVISRGTLALQQTQRNTAKAEIIKAIYTDIKAALEPEGYQVYETEYGPVIEFLNEKVDEKVSRMTKEGEEELYTGFVSIQIDAIMKNLDTNASHDEVMYYDDLEQKRIKEEMKEKQRLQKSQKDAEIRAEKARRREEEIARIEAFKQEKELEAKGE